MCKAKIELWEATLGEAESQLAGSYLECLEPALLAALPDCAPLSEVAQYLIRAGGRRIRPLVTLAMCDALGGAWSNALQAAAAVELVHTASLIHDDMLDRSGERRGQPAAHVKFGTNLALLTGDALIFAAFDVAQALHGAVSILNAACRSMCLGEVTGDRVESAGLKGGALLRAAAELGALVAGAPEKTLRLAGQYGEKLGTAYQLRDNELDEEQGASPRRFADDASSELEHLPASRARELLVQLTRFAWQRTR